MLRSCPRCGRIHDPRRKCTAPGRPRSSRADAFRNTAEWQRARNRVRDLDHNMCVLCRYRGSVTIEGLGVHHIVPLGEDYSLRTDEDNLATLCAACHEEAERGDVSREFMRSLLERYRARDE